MVMAKVMTISNFTLVLVTGSGLYCVLLFGICLGRGEYISVVSQQDFPPHDYIILMQPLLTSLLMSLASSWEGECLYNPDVGLWPPCLCPRPLFDEGERLYNPDVDLWPLCLCPWATFLKSFPGWVSPLNLHVGTLKQEVERMLPCMMGEIWPLTASASFLEIWRIIKDTLGAVRRGKKVL